MSVNIRAGTTSFRDVFATDQVFTQPSGTQVGDTLFFILLKISDYQTTTYTLPSGVTLVDQSDTSQDSGVLIWKAVAVTAGGTPTWTITPTASFIQNGICFATDGTAGAVSNNYNSGNWIATTVTSLAVGAQLVTVNWVDTTAGADAAQTLIISQDAEFSDHITNLYKDTALVSSPGASGSRTGTSPADFAAFNLVLEPVGGGGGSSITIPTYSSYITA